MVAERGVMDGVGVLYLAVWSVPTIGPPVHGQMVRHQARTRHLVSVAMAATTAQLVAHVLRRTTFGPYPGQVEAYLKKGPEKTIAAMLAATRCRPRTRPT